MRALFSHAWLMLLPAAAAIPAAAQEMPFVGVVVGDNVNIRAGASVNYYAVGQLNKGDLVRVHENLYGWYVISPTPGSLSAMTWPLRERPWRRIEEVSRCPATGCRIGDRKRANALAHFCEPRKPASWIKCSRSSCLTRPCSGSAARLVHSLGSFR